MLPKLKRSNWLILSGVLRRQEDKLLHVLQRNNMEIVNVKRRGKWIAVMAGKATQRPVQSSIIANSTFASGVDARL